AVAIAVIAVAVMRNAAVAA
ncbi:hypothetical protein A2U01_0007868, partial [Trifolium medium]|nr:hypothetical protein [Trifolium medium]